MKTHTQTFKQNISKLGREIDNKITYTIDEEVIELGMSDLYSITPTYNGALLKSVMKTLEIESKEEIPEGTEINYKFGLRTDKYYETTDTTYQDNKDYYSYTNNTYVLLIKGTDYNVGDTITGTIYNYDKFEYLDFGNYIVYKVEKQEDTYSWKLTCYDKMLYSMIDYEDLGVSYPITIRDYISAICTKLGLTFANANDTFCNYDREIQNELFLDANGGSLNYTFRDALDQLAEVTGSMICINEDDELELRYFNDTNDTIDEKYLKDINVKFGEKFGPVNSIVLSRSAESDNVYLSDDESIEEYGLTEIKIKDNQFMNFNDRDGYLPDLLDTLDGLEFYINDFSSTGITYLELGDIYNVVVGEETYKCLMLNDTLNVSQGLSEDIFTDRPDKSETDYKKADKTDRRINQAYIIVDKQNQQIEALTSQVTTIENTVGDSYTKEEVNQLIQTANEGVTNNFINSGGNNLLRNTGLWFEDRSEIEYMYPQNSLYPSNDLYMSADPHWEYWKGNAKKVKEDKASNMSGILLQTGYLEQQQQIRNGTYTLSFKYRKLIELSTVNVQINDRYIDLTNIEDTEIIEVGEITAQNISIKIFSDTDDSCVIYDLMLNAGSEKAEYSQHQNETTTDTVNISKGITIKSSDTNTTFKANSDGIRVYNSRDMDTPITEYTDTGMDTNRIKVKEEAEIIQVLWKNVGNNTWISRL